MIQGIVLVTATVYVVVNLLADVVYSLLDPRIRIAGGARMTAAEVAVAQPARAPAPAAAEAVPAPAGRGRQPRDHPRLHRDRRSSRRSIAPYSQRRHRLRPRCSRTRRGSHLFGTDELGRDVFSRLVWGARVSITVGFLATGLSLLIAVPIGLLAGYYRGWLDSVVARVTDVMLAFPFVILAIGLAAIMGPSLTTTTVALGIAGVPGLVRITRGETLALREADFVPAAVASGAGDATIVFRHILPNMSSTLLVWIDGPHPEGDHRRGDAVVPRPRRAAAESVVGRDAARTRSRTSRRRRGSPSTRGSRS